MTAPSPHDLFIRIAEPGPDRDACFAIRREVFVVEQNVPQAIEYDAFDRAAVHLLARRSGMPVGCARWIRHGDVARIGRVAVVRFARGQGIGAALMHRALETVAEAGFRNAILHAQVATRSFYAALGFVAEGPEFVEAGIPHVLMRKELP